MLIHTINKSPYSHSSLQKCLDFCLDDDAIVFLEDGVYALTHKALASVSNTPLYAIEADITARGLTETYQNQDRVQVISYEDFVALCIEYPKLKNW